MSTLSGLMDECHRRSRERAWGLQDAGAILVAMAVTAISVLGRSDR